MFEVVCGDVLEVSKTFQDNLYDAILCDPPYGISFMGKEWDRGVPSAEVWQELLRCLKPGGHMLAFGGTRMYHRLACNIEDAGFEIRDCLGWVYGSGFPKGANIGKLIDKRLGAERDVVGQAVGAGSTNTSSLGEFSPTYDETVPKTALPALFDGYKTALKPAWEPILLAMKPTAGSNADNAIRYGVAGLNIEPCRVAGDIGDADRYPANFIADAEAASLLNEQAGQEVGRFFYCPKASKSEREAGLESFEALAPTFGDKGGTYQGLSNSKSHRANRHPAVKPLELCEYLATLLLPPSQGRTRRILVPFSGSGSEMIGAMRAGWESVTGIEREQEYIDIANARLKYWHEERTGGRDEV